MSPEYTEMIAAIAIGVLSAIFISAFLVLIVICRRQKLYYKSTVCDNDEQLTSRPEVMLIEPEKHELELGEVTLNPNLEQILADEQWIDDATGLVPHCLAVLKTCRLITERLTALAIGPMRTSDNGLTQIIDSARKISARVDDMVRSMYPPLDPRLLEARAAALTLAVTHLALVARYEYGQRGKLMNWIDKSLAEMDGHMLVLREAALMQEASSKMQSVLSTTMGVYNYD